MRRAAKIAAWLFGVLLLLPVLAVAVVFAGLNMDPGRRLAERLIDQVTSGQVQVAGLSGRFPDHLRLATLTVKDTEGVWLSAQDVVLDWHPTALLRKQALIDRLQIARGSMARLPVSAPPTAETPAAPSAPFTLPVRVTARTLLVDRFELGKPVAGAPAVLALEGSADVKSLEAGEADLKIRRLDGEGQYALQGRIAPGSATGFELHASLNASEPAKGLVSGLAGLPDLGAVRLQVAANGPSSALVTRATVAAGELRAEANGTVNLDGQSADLVVRASAPAMQPRPDLSWQAISLDARVQGPFTKPDASGQLRVESLAAFGAGVRLLLADLDGNAGQVSLRAVAEGVRVPGPAPDLFAAEPLRLRADAKLDDPQRPVTFTLSHPVLSTDGRVQTAGELRAVVKLAVPHLAPLAAIGGVKVEGHANLTVQAAISGQSTNVDVDGTIGITGGPGPTPELTGEEARIGLSVQLSGQDITVSRAEMNGRTFQVSAEGTRRGDDFDFGFKAALSDLSVLAPAIKGFMQAEGRLQGRPEKFSANADMKGEVAAQGVPRGPITASVRVEGLPNAPSGEITAQGTLGGAPLRLRARATRGADGTLHATIEQADWRSAHADGELRLAPGAKLPLGKVSLKVGNLADFRPFVGQPISGQVNAEADLTAQEVQVDLDVRDAGIPGSRVGSARMQARIADPLGNPSVNAQIVADGIAAGGIGGSARIRLSGPQTALGIQVTANLTGVAGAAAEITGAATLDVPEKYVRVGALQAVWKGETLRLLAPARVSFANGVSVDQLRVGLRQAVLQVSGRLSPTLDVTASLRNGTAELARMFAPDLQAEGTLNAEAKLRGTPAKPEGTVRVQATGLRMKTGAARGLPAANVTATAQLGGGAARIDARVAAGNSTQLTITGRAPVDGAGPLDLRGSGSVDLAVLDPLLAADGRRVRGQLALNLGVAGTLASPRVTGSAQLRNGELQDYGQGVRLDDVNGTFTADGNTLRIANLTAKAGQGTIAVSGAVGVLSPGIPLDLSVRLRNARPLSSDKLSATVSGDLTLRGPVTGQLALGGTVQIQRAEITIPDRLPTSVAVLDVRRPGERRAPAKPAASGPDVTLDLTIQAPRAIFVRGRGVDAELAGQLRIRGSATKPQVSGGFEMRRGLISVAGTTLTFTRGRVGFDGTGPTGKIDPSLDFVAESSTSNVTARLKVGGYASDPKITLSSTPELPQDEVLAYLLFKRSAKELGPFQLASIAAALAQLTGVGGGIGDPLDSVRKGLGLDRLSVGGGTSNSSRGGSSSGPTLEAGRYIANGVYVGAKQGTTGSQTQAEVQIDITKGLKLQTDVGTGQGGNSVGLSYQFEW